MKHVLRSVDRGITLVEVAVMMTATVVIIGLLAPTVTAVVRHAEYTSAAADMSKITAAILAYQNEVKTRFTVSGSSNTRVNLLVSDGDIPRELSGSGSSSWQQTVDNTTRLVDFLERHLVTNNPGGDAANGYSTTGGTAWRGAYLRAPIDPDPWGNRFAVNVQFLGNADSEDVVVLSAGVNEIIETAFAVNGLVAGGDDIIVLVEQ